MVLGGIILLLPGLCTLLFAVYNRNASGPLLPLIMILIVTIGGGTALIWLAMRRPH
jgi:hypothetical protein